MRARTIVITLGIIAFGSLAIQAERNGEWEKLTAPPVLWFRGGMNVTVEGRLATIIGDEFYNCHPSIMDAFTPPVILCPGNSTRDGKVDIRYDTGETATIYLPNPPKPLIEALFQKEE